MPEQFGLTLFLFISHFILLLDLLVNGDDNGGSASEFIRQNVGKYTEGQVKKKLEALSTEGMIYSTIDDDHYSPVEEE